MTEDLVRLLTLAVGLTVILFLFFETNETPPSRATPTAQQEQYYFDRAHKLFIFGYPRNLRYHFEFESKHFAGLESA